MGSHNIEGQPKFTAKIIHRSSWYINTAYKLKSSHNNCPLDVYDLFHNNLIKFSNKMKISLLV